MKKNMEENQFNEDREEDIRINEGDTSPKPGKKNFKGFEELENMPDPDAQAEVEGGKFVEEDEGESNEFFEDDETERINQLKQDIYFHSSDGVVSVGPDVDGEQLEDFDQERSSTVKEIHTAKNIESMNPKRFVKVDYELRKSNRNTGEEKDNLKTMKKRLDNTDKAPFWQRLRKYFNRA